MEMLETALAFTVAMILFSTIVAGLVEATLRTLARRAHYVRKGVLQFLFEVRQERPGLLARAGLDLNADEATQKTWMSAAANDLTENRLIDAETVAAADTRGFNLPARFLSHLTIYDPKDHARVETMTSSGLAMRLADHEIGLAITYGKPLPEAERETATVEDRPKREREWGDMIRRYARYRALTNESYRRNARAFSLITAVAFAFVFNIEGGRLIRHLSENAAAREGLVATSDTVVDNLQTALTDLSNTLDLDVEALPEEAPDGLTDREWAAFIALSQSARQTADQIEEYAVEGSLPIGFSYWPHCTIVRAFGAVTCVDTAEGSEETGQTRRAPFLIWVVNTLIAGLLIGLGGPFWYRVFAGLSNLATLLRGAGGGVVPTEELSEHHQPTARDDGSIEAEVKRVVAEVMAATTPASGNSG
ncbi:MAG: hypothetical protein AAFU80_11530 [Pseudomonadota bacterium]